MSGIPGFMDSDPVLRSWDVQKSGKMEPLLPTQIMTIQVFSLPYKNEITFR